jgi:hypothetical protein
MGYTLTPIAVDLDDVNSAIGSRDEALLATLTSKFRAELDEINALGDDDEEEVEEGPAAQFAGKPQEALAAIQQDLARLLRGEKLDQDSLAAWLLSDEGSEAGDAARVEKCSRPCTTAIQALQHLVMGEEQDDRVGFKYGYVLELLCRHFGAALPNDRWSSLRRGSQWFKELDRTLQSVGVAGDALSVSTHLVERGSPVPIPEYSGFPSIGYLTKAEIGLALATVERADLGGVEDEAREYLKDIMVWLRSCADLQRDLVCSYA